MNIARDTRIATYVFSEPANFLLYYNNIRTDPSLHRSSSSLSLFSFRRRKREGESRQFSKDRKGRGDVGNKTINRARAATYGRAREGLGEENGGPCQRLPPLARKNGSCRGYRYRGPLFSRHPSRRRGEREREGRACRNRATSAAEARGERLERTKRRLGCWTNGRGRKRIAKGGGGGGVA